MKKLLSTVLVIVMILAAVSCASEQPEVVPEYAEGNDGTLDLSGYNLILSSDYNEDSATVFRYDRDTGFADLALQRIADVEQSYNCKVVPTSADFLSILTLSVAGGTHVAEAAFTSSYGLHNSGLIKGGMLLPMSTFPEIIDYKNSAKWGNSNQLESLVWNNELYGVVAISWPEYFYNACDFAVVVNETMIRSLGETDPREYIDDGTWSRELFADLVKRYQHTSNSTNTVYGMTFFKPHFYDIALKANGVEYAIRDGDTWTSGLHTSEAVDALQWAYDFINTDCIDYILTQDTYPAINTFVDGGSALLLTHMGFALAPKNTAEYQSIVYNVDDFGILPFPLGPNLEYGEWVGQHEYMQASIVFPVNCKEPEAAATVISAIFEPLPGYETQQELLDYYSTYTFHDPRDAQIIFKMLENCRYTYYIDGARSIVDALGSTSGSGVTVTTVLEKYVDSYETTVLENIVPVYESIENLWGE